MDSTLYRLFKLLAFVGLAGWVVIGGRALATDSNGSTLNQQEAAGSMVELRF
jgi:hypothetical protein